MAKNEENKAKKGLMSKVCNYRNGLPQEFKTFWGSISLTLGVIAFANSIQCVSVADIVHLILGGLLLIIGFFLLIKDKNINIKDKNMNINDKTMNTMPRIGITAGFTIFSAGIRIKYSAPILEWTNWINWTYWILIVLSILCITLGIYKACIYFKRKADNNNKKPA